MKIIRNLVVVLILLFILTGCAKLNTNMDINEDKSMDYSITYAVDENFSGLRAIKSMIDLTAKSFIDEGYTVLDYNQDGMRGYTISKKFEDIDEYSSIEETECGLKEIMGKNEKNIFKVEKELFKNKYTANFKIDLYDEESIEKYKSNEDIETDGKVIDLSNMEVTFNVSLPYSSISNNASTTSNNDKNLTWKIYREELENIEFQFELYNSNFNTDYIVGIIAMVIAVIIIRYSFLRGKNKVQNNENNNEN